MTPAKETITRTLAAHPDLSGAGWKYPHTRDHAANRARVFEDDEGYYKEQFERAVEYRRPRNHHSRTFAETYLVRSQVVPTS
jgi:hypothetical protein